MRSVSAAAVPVLAGLLVSGCGGDGDDSGGRAGRSPDRTPPETTIARWVDKGDCRLLTDRYVGFGYPSVAQGRRECQAEADETPVERYRVESARTEGRDATVVLRLRGSRTYTYWLVARGRRGWAIDGYDERRPGDGTVAAGQVLATFERRTGRRLKRSGGFSTPGYQVFSLPEIAQVGRRKENASREALGVVQRYGGFDIYVASDLGEAKRLVDG